MLARVIITTGESIIFLEENQKQICLEKVNPISPKMDDSCLNGRLFARIPFSRK